MSYSMRGLGLPPDVDPNKWYVDEQTFWVDEHDEKLYKGYSAHPEPTLPGSPTLAQWCRATPGPHFTRGPFEYGDQETGAVIRTIDLHAGELPQALMSPPKTVAQMPGFEPYACKTKMSVMQMSLLAAAGLAAVAGIVYVSRGPR